MSNKVLALPLSAIKSSSARGKIDGLMSQRDEIEAKIESLVGSENTEGTLLYELNQISLSLLEIFTKYGLDKIRMPDQTLVQKTTKKTSFISAECLLEHKVSLTVIQECTVTNTSKPFIRVDRPRVNKSDKGESK